MRKNYLGWEDALVMIANDETKQKIVKLSFEAYRNIVEIENLLHNMLSEEYISFAKKKFRMAICDE